MNCGQAIWLGAVERATPQILEHTSRFVIILRSRCAGGVDGMKHIATRARIILILHISHSMYTIMP